MPRFSGLGGREEFNAKTERRKAAKKAEQEGREDDRHELSVLRTISYDRDGNASACS